MSVLWVAKRDRFFWRFERLRSLSMPKNGLDTENFYL